MQWRDEKAGRGRGREEARKKVRPNSELARPFQTRGAKSATAYYYAAKYQEEIYQLGPSEPFIRWNFTFWPLLFFVSQFGPTVRLTIVRFFIQ